MVQPIAEGQKVIGKVSGAQSYGRRPEPAERKGQVLQNNGFSGAKRWLIAIGISQNQGSFSWSPSALGHMFLEIPIWGLTGCEWVLGGCASRGFQ